MDYFCAFSWPYSSSAEADARNFFNKLHTGIDSGKRFPLPKPHEIALVRNPSGDIFVGILVLTGTQADDSVETHEKIVSWFRECGAEGYQDYEFLPIRGQSIQSSFGVDYTVLNIINGSGMSQELRIKGEPIKKKRKCKELYWYGATEGETAVVEVRCNRGHSVGIVCPPDQVDNFMNYRVPEELRKQHCDVADSKPLQVTEAKMEQLKSRVSTAQASASSTDTSLRANWKTMAWLFVLAVICFDIAIEVDASIIRYGAGVLGVLFLWSAIELVIKAVRTPKTYKKK